MTQSYHRRCKKCGRLIQMRRMPGGQWVAWEGYDHVHDCSKLPPKNLEGRDYAYTKESTPSLNGLAFPDIDVKMGLNKPPTRSPNEHPEQGADSFGGLDFKEFSVSGGKGFERQAPITSQPTDSDIAKKRSPIPKNQQPAGTKPRRNYEWLKTLIGWVAFYGLIIIGFKVCHVGH